MARVSPLILFLFISVNLIGPPGAFGQSGPNDVDIPKAMGIMGIKEGMIIGEAGAGRGYFTFPMAEQVGRSGKIYANDIRNSALQSIENSCTRKSVTNIETVLGEVADPRFPVKDLDMVVIVHAFHDFTQKVKWLENLKKYMRSGTTLAILDRDPDRWGKMSYHFLTKEEMITILKNAGFKNIQVDTSLPNDNIYLVKQ